MSCPVEILAPVITAAGMLIIGVLKALRKNFTYIKCCCCAFESRNLPPSPTEERRVEHRKSNPHAAVIVPMSNGMNNVNNGMNNQANLSEKTLHTQNEERRHSVKLERVDV